MTLPSTGAQRWGTRPRAQMRSFSTDSLCGTAPRLEDREHAAEQFRNVGSDHVGFTPKEQAIAVGKQDRERVIEAVAVEAELSGGRRGVGPFEGDDVGIDGALEQFDRGR